MKIKLPTARTSIPLLLATWLALPAATVAAPTIQLPKGVPFTPDCGGDIRRVDLGTGEIVVGGRLLQLAPSVRVHSPHIQNDTVRALEVGRVVSCRFTVDGGDRIGEIWLFPRDYRRPQA
jgi:hypothetical protein